MVAVVCCILNHMRKVNPPAATGQPANFHGNRSRQRLERLPVRHRNPSQVWRLRLHLNWCRRSIVPQRAAG